MLSSHLMASSVHFLQEGVVDVQTLSLLRPGTLKVLVALSGAGNSVVGDRGESPLPVDVLFEIVEQKPRPKISSVKPPTKERHPTRRERHPCFDEDSEAREPCVGLAAVVTPIDEIDCIDAIDAAVAVIRSTSARTLSKGSRSITCPSCPTNT